jgi:nickel/cobalt exporter
MDATAFSNSLFVLWSQQPVLLGLAFGLLHAFDADHVAAISGLAVSDRSTSPMSYAIRWAFGHAAALALIAAFVLGLGLVGLTSVSGYAEVVVAATLVAVGLHALRDARRHVVGVESSTGSIRLGGRAGVLMGMLHGGAGSAAVIALSPIASFEAGFDSGVYLAFFSVGVAAGACGFSRMLAGAFACTERAGAKLRAALHAAVGVAGVVTGVLLFAEVAGGG